ncbi:VCBS repeat protein [Knoellia remsis]|uniref:VCBS repeat protein n=1 Tax=Knoellia remsis TaxID=407159 RepID=A0A2T0UNL0_9MICO|nr:FG-GAP-like repeat-containing protein [Knoellia remsis]PRY59519.1 VCBS repeat protein [Knoellia remsis]
MRTKLRRLVAALATAVVGAGVLAGPARAETADTEYPTLRAITASPASAAVGGPVTVAIDAVDDVALATIEVRFTSSEYPHTITLQQAWQEGGRFTLTVPRGSVSGRYSVERVSLTDTSGKSIHYATLGKGITRSPALSEGPFTHAFDLAAVAFTVTGGLDRTPPRITSLSMPTRPVYGGDPGALALTVDDPGTVTVDAWWQLPYDAGSVGGAVTITRGAGRVPVSGDSAGTYPLDIVAVTDLAGNERRYYRDGREWVAYGEQRHTLNLPQYDFTLRPRTPTGWITPHPRAARVVVAPADSEVRGLTGWRVTVNPGGIVRDVPVKAGSTQVDVAGLVNGTAYTVSVVARSATGDSRPLTRTIRPMPSTNVFAVADVTGDRKVDVIARRPVSAAGTGTSYVYPTNGTGGWGSRFAAFKADQSICERVAPGDVDVIGASEVLCYGPALTALRRDGSGYRVGSSGWSTMRFVDGGHDLTSDGRPDIVGVTADGALRLYETRTSTSIVASRQIGTGWQIYTAVFQSGDTTGDRRADLVALDTAGRLWLYAGNGAGGFAARRQIGSGWGGFGAVLPLRDFNGDGRADIGAIAMDGTFYLYPGNGRGGFLTRKQIGMGWQIFL